jgi:hypothetical protein
MAVCAPSCVAALVLFGTTTAAQLPRSPAPNPDFGQLAEGYTSAFVGGSLEAGYRMFSAPDFGATCADARADTVKTLRAAPAPIDARVGVPIPYTQLKIDALDVHGVLVPKVPIAIESYMWSDVLDVRQDHIGEGTVTPRQPGSIRLRIRTICDAPGGETFVTVQVVR